MTEQERFKRDIDTLRESIRREWQELSEKHFSAEERCGIRNYINSLAVDLQALLKRLG